MTRSSRLALALLVCALGSRGAAQDPHLGTLQFPTSATGKAQKEFVTGVLYLHNFLYPEAATAFRRAQQIDPVFAMAYWGEAMTYTHPVWNQQDTAAAGAVLRRLAPTRAARAAKAPTARERAYLDAVEILYGTGSKAARDTVYSHAMEKVAAAYPRDAEAQAFYALSLLGLGQGKRDVPTYMRAGAIAESLFAALPNHPGAAHYVIHAFDDAVHAPLGMRAARAYSKIAPDAHHAQHMTSHIFLAAGMWNETVHANEVATVATRDSAGRWPRNSCGHYGVWLQYAYLQMGRAQDAEQLLNECRAQAGSPIGIAHMRAVQIVETADWDGAEVHMTSDTAGRTGRAGGRGRGRGGPGPDPEMIRMTSAMLAHNISFADGYAAIKRGDVPAAQAALRAIDQTPPQIMADMREVFRLELKALIALYASDSTTALGALRRAVVVEDTVPVEFGPPHYIKPPRELLGEVLLQLGRPAEARVELERQLQRTPRRALTEAALKQAMSRVARSDQ